MISGPISSSRAYFADRRVSILMLLSWHISSNLLSTFSGNTISKAKDHEALPKTLGERGTKHGTGPFDGYAFV